METKQCLEPAPASAGDGLQNDQLGGLVVATQNTKSPKVKRNLVTLRPRCKMTRSRTRC